MWPYQSDLTLPDGKYEHYLTVTILVVNVTYTMGAY